MHDERLRQQRLDEPSGMEKLFIVGFHGRRGPVRGEAQAPEEKQHEKEGCVIEDRADGADIEHEFPYEADVPSLRFFYKFRVHVVGRDAGLGNVVQQVVRQHLQRRHGQERQEIAAAHHAEHVAEVRTRAHFDVFDDVGEHLAALDDAGFEHHEAPFQKNDVGRLLGDIDRGVHRDAHVRGFHCRGVVDAVSQEPDDGAPCAQPVDDVALSAGATGAQTPWSQ